MSSPVRCWQNEASGLSVPHEVKKYIYAIYGNFLRFSREYVKYGLFMHHNSAMFDTQTLGRFCKTSRKTAGLTLADLSARTRIPVRSLVRIEAGAPEAPVGRVLLVLRSLGHGLSAVPLSRPALESLSALYDEPDQRDESAVSATKPSVKR